MNIIIITYSVYLLLIAFIIIRVGWLIYREGAVYLHELFPNNRALGDYINRILLIAYYLLNLGYAALSLISWTWRAQVTWLDALQSLAENIGLICLILGVIHFINLIALQVFKQLNFSN